LSKKLKILVGLIQLITDQKIDEVASSINYGREHLSRKMGTGDPQLEKLLISKYSQQLDEFFEVDSQVLRDPEAKYHKKSKPKARLVDADSLIVHDLLQTKIMLRQVLRNQAELLATQQKKDVKIVLDEMNESLRAESSEEFDGL
jgi:polyphosphate kinase